MGDAIRAGFILAGCILLVQRGRICLLLLALFLLFLSRLAFKFFGIFDLARYSTCLSCVCPPEVPFDDGVLSNLDVQVVRSGW